MANLSSTPRDAPATELRQRTLAHDISEEKFKKLTVYQLKELLTAADLPVTGIRAVLIARFCKTMCEHPNACRFMKGARGPMLMFFCAICLFRDFWFQ